MKTFYSILGLNRDATADQIEEAYERFSSKLDKGDHSLSDEEVKNQLIATRESYKTLSNPILRQRYDQKLLDSESVRIYPQDAGYTQAASGGFFGLKTIGLIGLLVLAGLYFYNENAKERERLRIAHEREIQLKIIEIEEAKQRQNSKVQDNILDRTASYSSGEQLRQQQQQFERESLQQQQLDMQRRNIEFQQQQQLKREEENRQRQEQSRRQQQLQSEKRLLQQMERDRYGKVITH